jgi:thiamine pyrophosphokinase
MSLFTILLGGRLIDTPRLRAQIAGARVIAADSGMAHAETLGVVPEVWVGDFDSASLPLQNRHASVPRLSFPAEKDATDGELACDEAVKRGAAQLVLAGAFGGQADHLLGTITHAVSLRTRGHEVLLTSGDEEGLPLVPGTMTLELSPGRRVSVLALTDLSRLSISGVKWPLLDRDVPTGSSLTLSNVATGPVSITLAGGHGAVIVYP